MRRRHSICLAFLLAAASGSAQAQQPIDTLALRAHTRFLADDLLAGRGTGTAGERVAAAYIASTLLELGLQPLVGQSFLIPVPIAAAVVLPSGNRVTVRNAAERSFDHGADYVLNTGARTAFHDFTGAAAYVGTADQASADHAPLLAGKVAVVLGPLGAAAEALIPAWERAGVVGVVVLIPDAAQFDLYRRSRGPERFFIDGPIDDPVWQPALPVLLAGPRLSAALMAGVALPPAASTGASFEPVALDAHVAATIAISARALQTANVAGVIPGTDPQLRDELILYTAHYDHLGIDTSAGGDSIYNGFSDNAAGAAMLLAIAKSLRDAPPARSVAFLFLTGEERGLLGATHLAQHGALHLDRVRALINLDAGAPPAPPVSWRIAGGESDLGRTAQAVGEEQGWTIALSGPSPNSDYWPFLRLGVPAIFIVPGDEWENTSMRERDALRARWDRYHQAGDEYSSAFPFRGLQRYAEFARAVGLRVANRK